jgi:plastocyanin
MPSTRRRKRFAASLLSVLGSFVLILALLGSGGVRVLAQDDEEDDAEPEPITIELMGTGVPSTVDGQVLELRKITFQPGALLPAHTHPGALVLTVAEGELAYTLFEGEASIQRAGEDGEPGPVEPFVVGEETILEVGDSVFEEDVLHQAENKTDEPTVLWVASLLEEGEPFVHLEEEAEGTQEAEEEDQEESEEEALEGAVKVSLNEFEIRMPDEIPAGETTFAITNTGSLAHSFAISGGDVEASLDAPLAPGASATLTVDLPVGEYEVICPVANHAELGMTTTLTVVEGGGEPEGEDGEEEAEEITIEIVDFAFDPAEVEIAPGTTVTWVNNDSAPHTATSDDGVFDSGTLEPGDSFSFTFEDTGTFAYHCDIHPNMTATITVAESAEDGGNGGAAANAAVEIADFAFSPESLEVEAGTTVTWINNDSAPHTVTSDDGAFDSGTLETGDTFSFTFDEAGTFAYHCDIHPRMTATVEVS